MLQDLNGMIAALRAQVIGQRSPGKVGIAAPDQHEIAGEAAIAIQHAGCFYRGMKLVIGAYQR